MEPLLQVSGLRLDYSETGGSHIPALRNIDLDVNVGETVGILGESGSGKSSLALSLLQLLPGNARIISGEIRFKHRNLLLLDQEELRGIRGAEIALIFQEPALALNPVLPVSTQIGDVLRAHRRVPKNQAKDAVYAMLREVGFPEPERIARACPHQLSGGQQQRVAIAQALICKPSLLIADEPLSSLDTVTQAEMLELLGRLKKELALAMLLITHDAGVLGSLADRIAVLRSGVIVANGTRTELAQMPDPYVKAIVSPPQVLSTVTRPAGDEKPLLQVRNLSKHYEQGRMFSRKKFAVRALHNVDLSLFAGGTIALVGRSGSGKTTLAKCIAGFEKPDAGEITLRGLRTPNLKGQRPQEIQLLFQDTATSFNPRFTAEQIISEPLDLMELGSREERRQKVIQRMQEVGLDAEARSRRAAEFSGGQRQRLALARALIVQPKILVLDEALTGLDIPLQASMISLLLDLQRKHNLAYLYISHDLNFVSLFAQQIAVMDQGRIIEQTFPDRLHNSTNPETLALLATSQTVNMAKDLLAANSRE